MEYYTESIPNLFWLPSGGFKNILEQLDTPELFSLGIASLQSDVRGENINQLILEDARRHKNHVMRPKGPYKSILEYSIRTRQDLPVIEHFIDLYQDEYPEYVQYNYRSHLVDVIIRSGYMEVLELLIDMDLAPSVAQNGETYMSAAITHRAHESIVWLIEKGVELRHFMFTLDRRGLLERGTLLCEYIREHTDALDTYVPVMERKPSQVGKI